MHATWATLEILDYSIKVCNPNDPTLSPHDWDVSNNIGHLGTIVTDPVAARSSAQTSMTSKRANKLRRAGDPDTLLQELATAPKSDLDLPPDYLSIEDFNPPTSDLPAPNPLDEITVDVDFQSTPVPYKPLLYQFRVLMLMAMHSTATDIIEPRWPDGRTVTGDPRVPTVQAIMVFRGPKRPFPQRPTFAEITDGLRQILAQCIRHGSWVAFRAQIRRNGFIIAELGMEPPSAKEQEVASA